MFKINLRIIPPYLLAKLLTRDQFVGTVDKQGKDFGGLWLKLERVAVLSQDRSLGIEVKGPETVDASSGWGKHQTPRLGGLGPEL